MDGIDISRWQRYIDLAAVPSDFVIIKATQGTNYVSQPFLAQMTKAMELGKLVGVYHYCGNGGGSVPEAEHFVKTVKNYIGKAILVLDWEGEQNPNFDNPHYALAWLKYVRQLTGITPFVYMSKSVCRQYKDVWDTSFPLWCAQYKNYNQTGYQDNPWTDNKGFGAWKDCKILQYSSKGKLVGYQGDLDLDKAYMDADEWKRWACGDIIPEKPAEKVYPILRKGDRNQYVKAWQIFLNQNGYSCGNADGIFGKKTEKAVKAWQKVHGLVADGIIGPLTWGSLPMMK